MKWTEAQQQAIEQQGKNLLVSAAAGSGKTAVLVERIKEMILSGQTDVDRVLVVTFTRAAADEMKEKLIRALTEEIEEHPENARAMKEQLDRMHRAAINTFHSFALDLVRRYYYIIDLDPGSQIMDETEATMEKRDALDRVFEEAFEKNEPEFLAFLDGYSTSRSEEGLKDELMSLYNRLQSMEDPLGWMGSSVKALSMTEKELKHSPLMEGLNEQIHWHIQQAVRAYGRALDLLEDAGLEKLASKEREEWEGIRKLQEVEPDRLKQAVEGLPRTVLRATKEEKEAYEEIREAVKGWRERGKEAVKALQKDWLDRSLEEYCQDMNATAPAAQQILTLLRRLEELYGQAKREAGIMDFDDIEHFAIRILADDGVAEEYRRRFDYIFIDEYQDSNYLQEAIVDRIRREDNLFLVGDIKQSIYRFRQAEPDIFRARAEAYGAEGESRGMRIDLNRNFRSKGEILTAINDIFSEIMEGYDERAALYPGLTEDGGIHHPVEMVLVDGSKGEEIEEEEDDLGELRLAELEALAAVKTVNRLLGQDFYDSKEGTIRPIQKKDIVILMRGVKHVADVYYEALAAAGIDAFVQDTGGYFDTLEIRLCTDLLRVIDNSRRDISLLAVLRSPVFDFSIEELVCIRREFQEGSYRQALLDYAEDGSDPQLRQRAGSVFEQLARWKETCRQEPLDDFLWNLMRQTGIYTYVGALPGGAQRQANLRALVDRAGDLSARWGGSIHGLLRYVQAMGDRNVEMEQVKLVGEEDDVVRIMTIHKSKGLEFPVVIVAGLGRQSTQDRQGKTGLIHREIGFGMSRVEHEEHWRRRTLPERLIMERQRRDGLEEEIRILYVAMTRARDRLVLMGGLRDLPTRMERYEAGLSGDSCYLDMIYAPAKKSGVDCHVEDRSSLAEVQSRQIRHMGTIRSLIHGEGLKEYKMRRDPALGQVLAERLEFVYPYADEVDRKAKYSVTELNRESEGTAAEEIELAVPRFQRAGEEQAPLTGARRGTIYHTILEHLDLLAMAKAGDPAKQAGDLSRQMEEMIRSEILTREEVDVVELSEIQAFLDGDMGKRILHAAENDRREGEAVYPRDLHRESPFHFLYDKGGSQVLVQGVIDCWFRDEKGLVVLDYKTNRSADGIRELYGTQMELYRQALEASTGQKVAESWIYLLTEGRLIDMG